MSVLRTGRGRAGGGGGEVEYLTEIFFSLRGLKTQKKKPGMPNNKYSQQFMCEIWTTTTNTSNKYIKPAMSLYSLSINVHTISNPQHNDIICMLTNHFVWTMRWLWLRLRLHRLLECSRTIYNHGLYITTVHSQAGRCIYAYNTHIPIIDYLMQ